MIPCSVLARLTDHEAGEVRARAVWALGRIGRACTELIKAYLPNILAKVGDADPKVRGAVISACESIAAERPEWFADAIPAFLHLLDDPNVRYVRREAPKILRIIGRQHPEIVDCAVAKLTEKLDDDDRVVRIHAQAALNSILVRNES